MHLPAVSCTVNDRFADVLGTRRGSAGRDGALSVTGSAGAERARALLALVHAGALSEPLAALATIGPVEGAADAELTYAWPPKDLAERARQRETDRRWSSTTPCDEDAELSLDAVDTVRRAVAERAAAQAVAEWTPVFREFAHAIGLRRSDMADHVVCIENTLHVFEPADVLLAGDRGYTQTMGCGESAYASARDGKLTPVARGVWAQMGELDRHERPLALCPKCSWSSTRNFTEARTETADGWLPLAAEQWGWVLMNATARVHQELQRRPGMSRADLAGVAVTVARERYLGLICTPMQQNDKPCRWYHAAALTEAESREVRRLTYDRRIGQPVTALLDAQCPATPTGFTADEPWRRQWCDRLLAHLRAADESRHN